MFLTFDPERLRMLRQALSDISLTIDRWGRHETNAGIEDLIKRASGLVELQISRVDSSLREIDTRIPAGFLLPPSLPPSVAPDSSTRPVHVEDLIAQYRDWADRTPHWWTQATTNITTRSDDILRSLSHETAGELIDALPDLELFVLGTADLSTVESIWTLATDPSTTPSAVAGRRIRRLLCVIFDERPWERGIAAGSIDPVERSRREIELRNLTARIIAPWQVDMTSRPDWGWTATTGTRRLHQISELESTSDILVNGLAGALQHSLARLPEDPESRRARIDAVAQAIGTSIEVHQMSDVDRARSDSGLDTLRNVLGTLAIDGPWPISILLDAGAQWVGEHFDTSDARIDTAILESLEQREVLASIAVITVMAASLARSRRDASRPVEPRQMITQDMIDELRYTYQSIDNAAGRGQSLARLTRNR